MRRRDKLKLKALKLMAGVLVIVLFAFIPKEEK